MTSPMTTGTDIEALVDEFERCSNEVALSGYGHNFDPGQRYKQEARDEALTDLMRAVNNLRASLTAAGERIKTLEGYLHATGCTCTSYGSVSFPPQPTDHVTKHWCGRCKALGLDKAEPSLLQQQADLSMVFGGPK